MAKRAVTAAAVCALVVLLAGCSSGSPEANYSSVSTSPSDSPSASRTASSSASASPSVPTTGPNVRPGETPPTRPPAANQDTAEGAQAFAAYYVKSVDWVYATSTPSILDGFYAPECTTCRSGLQFIESLTANGAHIVGGRLSIRRVALVDNDNRGGASYAVSSELASDAATVINPSGATAASFPAQSPVTLTDWMRWDGKKWLIVDERYA